MNDADRIRDLSLSLTRLLDDPHPGLYHWTDRLMNVSRELHDLLGQKLSGALPQAGKPDAATLLQDFAEFAYWLRDGRKNRATLTLIDESGCGVSIGIDPKLFLRAAELSGGTTREKQAKRRGEEP